jgi:hypothetical protein
MCNKIIQDKSFFEKVKVSFKHFTTQYLLLFHKLVISSGPQCYHLTSTVFRCSVIIKLCEQLDKLIGKRVTAIQKLNTRHYACVQERNFLR